MMKVAEQLIEECMAAHPAPLLVGLMVERIVIHIAKQWGMGPMKGKKIEAFHYFGLDLGPVLTYSPTTYIPSSWQRCCVDFVTRRVESDLLFIDVFRVSVGSQKGITKWQSASKLFKPENMGLYTAGYDVEDIRWGFHWIGPEGGFLTTCPSIFSPVSSFCHRHESLSIRRASLELHAFLARSSKLSHPGAGSSQTSSRRPNCKTWKASAKFPHSHTWHIGFIKRCKPYQNLTSSNALHVAKMILLNDEFYHEEKRFLPHFWISDELSCGEISRQFNGANHENSQWIHFRLEPAFPERSGCNSSDPRNLLLQCHWDGFNISKTNNSLKSTAIEFRILNAGKFSNHRPFPIVFVPLRKFDGKTASEVVPAVVSTIVDELEELFEHGIQVVDGEAGKAFTLRTMPMQWAGDYNAHCEVYGGNWIIDICLQQR
ncbi:hypothetical protein SELMODRAFT_432585 [Selaginella moellendorffii]|uniref:Uncharacterized protein n=1 Tax=Selaginella moellendorffii TaxID=88036 RepID=D8TGG3_SELML|nr:hypothetical protein SELMODRAFT_432585 [Selaginella moellendorffii]